VACYFNRKPDEMKVNDDDEECVQAHNETLHMFTVKRKLFYDRHCDMTNYRFCIGEDDIASFKVDDGRFEKVGMRV
jgi:hypothetical protein